LHLQTRFKKLTFNKNIVVQMINVWQWCLKDRVGVRVGRSIHIWAIARIAIQIYGADSFETPKSEGCCYFEIKFKRVASWDMTCESSYENRQVSHLVHDNRWNFNKVFK
jgi:hypothetical protein